MDEVLEVRSGTKRKFPESSGSLSLYVNILRGDHFSIGRYQVTDRGIPRGLTWLHGATRKVNRFESNVWKVLLCIYSEVFHSSFLLPCLLHSVGPPFPEYLLRQHRQDLYPHRPKLTRNRPNNSAQIYQEKTRKTYTKLGGDAELHSQRRDPVLASLRHGGDRSDL